MEIVDRYTKDRMVWCLNHIDINQEHREFIMGYLHLKTVELNLTDAPRIRSKSVHAILRLVVESSALWGDHHNLPNTMDYCRSMLTAYEQLKSTFIRRPV